MTSSLSGTRIAIVGGTSGIGFAIAKLAHDEGATVIVCSSNEGKVSNAVKRLGGHSERIIGEVVNVRSEEDVKEFFTRIGTVDHFAFTVCVL
jgi:NAD(P)-dependent dehydrogenase (short-subunit alcohol dehydrogenase family)